MYVIVIELVVRAVVGSTYMYLLHCPFYNFFSLSFNYLSSANVKLTLDYRIYSCSLCVVSLLDYEVLSSTFISSFVQSTCGSDHCVYADRDVIAALQFSGGGQLDFSTRELIARLGCGPRFSRLRGCRAALHVRFARQRRYAGQSRIIAHLADVGLSGLEQKAKPIPVVLAEFRLPSTRRCKPRERVLHHVTHHTRTLKNSTSNDIPPTLYVLNAAAITKPHAIQHLSADLQHYHIISILLLLQKHI